MCLAPTKMVWMNQRKFDKLYQTYQNLHMQIKFNQLNCSRGLEVKDK